MAAPPLWVGIAVVIIVTLIVLNFVPFLGSIAQILLWALFSGGLLLGCHALAKGRPFEFGHAFAGFQDGRAGPLVVLGLVAFGFSAILAITVLFVIFGAAGMSGMSAMMGGDAFGRTLAGMGIAALITVPLVIVAGFLFLLAWWFAPALVVLNRVEPIAALKASWDAAWKNLGAIAIFLLIYIGLAILATIPFGLGWLVLAPVATGGAYASWREVFGD